MKRTAKFIPIILCLAILCGALFGVISSAATGAKSYTAEIVSKNIQYGEKMYMAIAVAPVNGATLPSGVGVRTYLTASDSKPIHETHAMKSMKNPITDTMMDYFVTYGIAAREINSTFWYAVVDKDGNEISERIPYSAAQYANERLSSETAKPKQVKLYNSILAYGNAADKIFGMDRTENLIYNNNSSIFVIHGGDDIAISAAKSISYKLTSPIGVMVRDDKSTENYHEIVVGRTDREISKLAYDELDKLIGEDEKVGYLIYSNGRSIALAYTDSEAATVSEALVNIFAKDYLKESLTAAPGVLDSYTLDLLSFISEYEAEKETVEWERLESLVARDIGDADAENLITALKDLYSLYTPNVVEWFANLYYVNASNEGGYYYSNSARDNATVTYQGETYPLLPDIESTNQALGFFTGSGMLRTYSGENLPQFMREQIVNFVLSCQRPNGYFYHDQWPDALTDTKISRRSRDLNWATNILSSFGAKPYYDTPNGVKGVGAPAEALTMGLSASEVSAVSYVVAQSTAVNKNLESLATFKSYLNGFETSTTRNIANHSYSIGNELATQTSEILQRDKELNLSGENSLAGTLIKWLNDNQNTETGHWHHTQNYYGVNGLLKISGIYNNLGAVLPNADKATESAIAAITSDENMGAVVDIYNPWFAISNIIKNIRTHGNETDNANADALVARLRGELAVAAISASKAKIAPFKKADGSFSYEPDRSASTSQGMPVAINNKNEGDVNGTVIAISGLIGNIFDALELGNVQPALFGETEFRTYMSIIDPNYETPLTVPAAMKLFEKISSRDETEEMRAPLDVSKYELLDFDDGVLPERVTSKLYSTGSSVEVLMKELVYITKPGANDSLIVMAEKKSGANVSVLNMDIKISDASYNSALCQMMFDATSGTRAYMFQIGYEYGYITLSDASSNGDPYTRNLNTMKIDVPDNVYFNLGIEYCAVDANTVKIKVFVDGELIYVSDNYYNSHISGTKPQSDLAKVTFYTLNAVKGTFTIDNVRFAQDNLEFTDLTVGAK